MGTSKGLFKVHAEKNHNFPRISIYCFPKAEGTPSPLVAMAMSGGRVRYLDSRFHMVLFYNKEYF